MIAGIKLELQLGDNGLEQQRAQLASEMLISYPCGHLCTSMSSCDAITSVFLLPTCCSKSSQKSTNSSNPNFFWNSTTKNPPLLPSVIFGIFGLLLLESIEFWHPISGYGELNLKTIKPLIESTFGLHLAWFKIQWLNNGAIGMW